MGRYGMGSLAMYGGDDLGAFMTAEDLKDSLMAGGAGAVGILATNWVLGKLPSDMLADPANNSRLKSAIAVGIGILGGRAIYMYGNRDAAMGFVGGVAGAGLAALIASWMPDTFPSTSLSGGLADADLSALEATVATNSGAWRPPAELSSPNVAAQQLQATFTANEEIAAYNAMMNQPVNPPSF